MMIFPIRSTPTINDVFPTMLSNLQYAAIVAYLSSITGESPLSTIGANDFTSALHTYFGEYHTFVSVDNLDLSREADWQRYFNRLTAKTIYTLKAEYNTLRDSVLPKVGYGKITRKTGTDSKDGTHDTTTEGETHDSGTVSDSGTNTATNTTDYTTTTTPNGTVTYAKTGSDTVAGTSSLGAWDDTLYKGATQDNGSTTYNTTETETDNKVITQRTNGNTGSVSGTSANTRTIDTGTTQSNTTNKEYGETVTYDTQTAETGGNSPQELAEIMDNVALLNTVLWFTREFVRLTCYQTYQFFD